MHIKVTKYFKVINIAMNSGKLFVLVVTRYIISIYVITCYY